MTAPRFVDCLCGHPKTAHDALAPQCSASACTCLRYRPVTAKVPAAPSVAGPVAPRPAAPITGPTAEQLIAAGKRAPRTAKLAERIAADLDRLRLRLLEERQAAEAKQRAEAEKVAARAEVDRLEAELAAARAKLRGSRTPPSHGTERDVADASLPCPDCDQSFSTPQGRGAHRAKVHGYRKDA